MVQVLCVVVGAARTTIEASVDVDGNAGLGTGAASGSGSSPASGNAGITSNVIAGDSCAAMPTCTA